MTFTPPDGWNTQQSQGYGMVTAYLQKQPGDIDVNFFAGEFGFASAILADKYPCVGNPTTLSTNDMVFFYRAVNLAVAARMYTPITTGIVGGNAIQVTSAEKSSERYVSPSDDTPDKWVTEGMESLMRVSCIKAGLVKSAKKITMNGVAGHTRAMERRGIFPSMLAFGLGLLDFGAYPLIGYVGTDYFRNGDFFNGNEEVMPI